MKIIRHYKKTVSEADEIQTGNGNGTSDGLKSPNQNHQNTQKVTAINAQIAELLNQRLQKKTQYQQDIKAIEDKIVQLQKQLAEIIKEGRNVFMPPYDMPNVKDMKKRDNFHCPFKSAR